MVNNKKWLNKAKKVSEIVRTLLCLVALTRFELVTSP